MKISKSFINRVAGFLLILVVPGIIIIGIDRYRYMERIRGKYLFYPSNWEKIRDFKIDRKQVLREDDETASSARGGRDTKIGRIRLMSYTVQNNDTLSGIAEKFGLMLDTVASLNRTMGEGVHLLSVGEKIKIPTMDGLFLTVKGDFDRFCRSRDLSPDVVLEANGIQRSDLRPGIKLFFPGIQHSGIERSIIIGVAFARPVSGIVTSGYGFRHDPFTGNIRFHHGIDIAAPRGRPVRCAMDGRVIAVGRDGLLGKYVLVMHPEGFSTLYGHLSRVLVGRGQVLKKGTRLGLVGSTGRATGPHLHFEIRFHGKSVNPKGMVLGI